MEAERREPSGRCAGNRCHRSDHAHPPSRSATHHEKGRPMCCHIGRPQYQLTEIRSCEFRQTASLRPKESFARIFAVPKPHRFDCGWSDVSPVTGLKTGRRIRPPSVILRKEVIQPQVPLRLPCYDLVPITKFALGTCLPKRVGSATLGAPRFRGLTGSVYKAQEHIHRSIADLRLLAIPASCRRVSACNPN